MAIRYLDADKVKLPSCPPQFVKRGHCVWCNKPLTGKATRYCRPEGELWEGGPKRTISLCTLRFNRYFYSRPAYQRATLIHNNFTCQKCGLHPVREDKPWLPDLSQLHCDHIIPLCEVGYTEMKNLQTLCARCNLKKGRSIAPQKSKKRRKLKKCDICGKRSEILLRWPDGKDRCVSCSAENEGRKEEK